MVEITPVRVPVVPAPAFDDVLFEQARGALGDRAVWHINTTAVGGGVSEMLRHAMSWHARCGIDANWLVMNADQEFFGVTKQLHHLFHGSPGHGRPLGRDDFAVYERSTRQAAAEALAFMSPGDVVMLHDPQTLGMAPTLNSAGMHVAWRSHIGTRSRNPQVDAVWAFLGPFLDAPLMFVFSSPSYVPAGFPAARTMIIPPAIDETSDKCRPMAQAEVHDVLAAIGLVDADTGRPSRVDPALTAYLAGRVTVLQDRTLPPGPPNVLQLARWDPLKDMAGTLTAFARHVAPATAAHLVLAGPDPADIPDDPDNQSVFEAVLRQRAELPGAVRERVHLVTLGLADDAAELRANAMVVNALQRNATVIAQKSLEEGFGLAVAEAMLKSRPVVAGSVGGIRLQVQDEVNGLLVHDPTDLAAFGAAVTRLLGDDDLRDRLAKAGRQACERLYVVARESRDHARLYARLCQADLCPESPAAGG